MEITIVSICACLLLSIIFNFKIYSEIISLRIKNSELQGKIQKTEKEKEELVSIDPGDKALIPNYGLSHTTSGENFYVTYEVDIVEVSQDNVKVKAKNFTSNDKWAKDPSHKQAIILFMQDKWVSKKEIELIVDDQMRRDKKLQQILN